MRRSFPILVNLLVGLTVGLFVLFPPGKGLKRFLERAEWLSYDVRMRYRAPQPLDPRLTLVGLTNLDYVIFGEELYRREEYVLLLQALKNLGTNAVLMDILFDHPRPLDELFGLRLMEMPSFLSYKFLLERLPIEQVASEVGVDIEREYEELEEEAVIRSTIEELMDQRDLIMFEREQPSSPEAQQAADQKLQELKFRLQVLKRKFLEAVYAVPMAEEQVEQLYQAREVVLPSAALLLHCTGVGFINIMKGEEEVVRQLPLLFAYRGKAYPHLTLVFICHYYGIALQDLKISLGEEISFTPRRNYSVGGEKRIPIDARGNYLVNFRDVDTFLGEGVFFTRLLHYEKFASEEETLFDPSRFKDAIVIVGENVVGGTDTQPIPLKPVAPLVSIHGNVLDNILREDYITRSGWGTQIAVVLLGVLAVGGLFNFLSSRYAVLCGFVLLVSYIFFTILAFNQLNYVLPWARPLVGFVAASLLILVYTVSVKEREERKIRSIFFKTVSEEIGREILTHREREAIWGGTQRATIMFVDIRGFSAIAERVAASRVVELLNIYYDFVSRIIFEERGQVNKFLGDGVLALFGAPLSSGEDELQALRAAVRIQKALRKLNEHVITPLIGEEMSLGVGVNSGEVVVGTVGGAATRIEYTALGDAVNVAERLQAQARAGEILIGEETYHQLETHTAQLEETLGVQFLAMTPLQLTGRTQPVKILRVVYDSDKEKDSEKQHPEL